MTKGGDELWHAIIAHFKCCPGGPACRNRVLRRATTQTPACQHARRLPGHRRHRAASNSRPIQASAGTRATRNAERTRPRRKRVAGPRAALPLRQVTGPLACSARDCATCTFTSSLHCCTPSVDEHLTSHHHTLTLLRRVWLVNTSVSAALPRAPRTAKDTPASFDGH